MLQADSDQACRGRFGAERRVKKKVPESFGYRAKMKDLGLLYRSLPSVPRETHGKAG